ncbi:MAG: SDR family oxidoreductase [Acidimicrobiales bacterium]|nr:SDR family oxidoreductase [Acidimicrobiales bacterium]
MTGRLQDQVCLITGAAQGIGAAYARACAGEGASVAIVDLHRIDQAAEVEHDIAAMGQRSIALRADVTDAEAMLEVGRRVVEEFGRIDCLVNNAGLMFDQLTATWDDFLAVNFMGAINASNAVIPYMWEQRSGSIVNISSTAAFPLSLPILTKLPADAPAPRIVPEGYGMTKWMLIRQTRTMAQTLGNRGIRVNAVCPGVTMSPAAKAVVPDVIVQQLVDASLLGSTLEPDDMAGLIVYLASNESSKMTGQVLINDAGTWFGG